jgi:hypothetical protein
MKASEVARRALARLRGGTANRWPIVFVDLNGNTTPPGADPAQAQLVFRQVPAASTSKRQGPP